MQLSHSMVRLETAVNAQMRLGGRKMAEFGEAFLEALRPAMQHTLLEVVESAATEISSQMVGQRVEIRMREGDPDLVLVDLAPPAADATPGEALEARITLRLSESLKEIIEEAAEVSGDSVNSWVVNALRSKTQGKPGTSMKGTIEL